MGTKRPDMRDKANRLVSQFGSNVGEPSAALDEQDDRSFGEFGFHYDADTEMLIARVYVADAYLTGEYAKPDHFRRVLSKLNDSQIASHDRAGGEFELDENKEMYFLVRKFPVPSTSSATLKTEMEKLINAGAGWSMKWFVEIVDAVNREPKSRTAFHRAGRSGMALAVRRARGSSPRK